MAQTTHQELITKLTAAGWRHEDGELTSVNSVVLLHSDGVHVAVSTSDTYPLARQVTPDEALDWALDAKPVPPSAKTVRLA